MVGECENDTNSSSGAGPLHRRLDGCFRPLFGTRSRLLYPAALREFKYEQCCNVVRDPRGAVIHSLARHSADPRPEVCLPSFYTKATTVLGQCH
jgi:hypothetical protein